MKHLRGAKVHLGVMRMFQIPMELPFKTSSTDAVAEYCRSNPLDYSALEGYYRGTC